MNVLVVGGSGVAGQCAIRAVSAHDPNAEIWATTSRDADVVGATRTLSKIDLNDPQALVSLKGLPERFDFLFYTPAFGTVGSPVADATREQVEDANAFCLDPMVELAAAIEPGMTVAYTAYYFKPHLLAFYGALAYVKYATEKLAVENPTRFKCLRIGSFVSKATRGIGLLLQRQAKGDAPHLKPLMEAYRQSGQKFSDFFFSYIAAQEKQNIAKDRPYHMTTEDDIIAAHLRVLRGESAPILNVLGDQLWPEMQLPALPPEMQRADDLVKTSLAKTDRSARRDQEY
jgi:hypothetical protein